eukprot:9830158-Heterocapsa_arctica.AAC.1
MTSREWEPVQSSDHLSVASPTTWLACISQSPLEVFVATTGAGSSFLHQLKTFPGLVLHDY